jgi:hypothetical protein
MTPATIPSLGVETTSMFSYATQLFTTLWPLIAVGLGLIIAPRLFSFAKTALSGGGGKK